MNFSKYLLYSALLLSASNLKPEAIDPDSITGEILNKFADQENGLGQNPAKIEGFKEKCGEETVFTLKTTIDMREIPRLINEYKNESATEHEKKTLLYKLITTFFDKRFIETDNKKNDLKIDEHTRGEYDVNHAKRKNQLICFTCFTEKEAEEFFEKQETNENPEIEDPAETPVPTQEW